MKSSTQSTVAILRKTPRTTRRNFLKQTGGLTLASAFGLGFVANKQQLLAEDSGGSPPPPSPPPPPPRYYLSYVFSTASGMVPAETASATGLGSFNVNMQVTMDPEPNYDNQSPTITVTYRARVWTTGGNGKTVTGYNTNGYPYLGQSWPFPGVSVAAAGDVAKEVKAEITVTFSADAQGKLVITGGENWVDAEEEKLVENLGNNDVRVRQVVSHVKIRRNGLKIEARGWVAHMFDGYELSPTTGKVTDGIQNDVKNGNVLNHTVIHIPGGSQPASFPFSRLYEVRGPFPY